tara:strand:- start:41691 stop:42236 length:546 start_codon:yes stop_codon:yes gene_type:complete
MPRTLLNSALLVAVVFTLLSCVKDTDFEQADDIALTPEAEVNFLYFTLTIDDFESQSISEEELAVIDTTEIRFLDDEFAIENITRADFFFKVTNTFPVGLDVNLRFLSEDNVPYYEINFPIALSENNSPEVTEFTQVVSMEEIEQLTQNDKVAVRINIESDNQDLDGSLNLQSKTTYYLQF